MHDGKSIGALATLGLSFGLMTAAQPNVARAQELRIDVFRIPTPASRPYTITAGPDGCLYFTESHGDRIGRITPEGVITEFDVPTPDCGPYGIATGADGAIWFTERFADQIGRLDPATGRIDEFPVNTPFAQPWEITAGPDGNLWFTEEDVHQIGRIRLNGNVTEYPAGACCFPTGITTGADGHLWSTIEIGDQLVRMTTGGDATLFPVQTELQLLLWDITPGPDGNLWFTELAGRAIGRVTPDGDIRRFPVPGEFSGITGIAAGPDGLLWFTENDTARVGAMRPDGEIVFSQAIEPDSRPLSIVHGPDGNLWFTMADGNAIGRIRRARNGTACVLSMDAGFSPADRECRLGDTVQWTFVGPRTHGVRERSGLDLFDSGPKPIVSYFSYPVTAAGTYLYEDSQFPVFRGRIRAGVDAPKRGTTGEPFSVVWATQTAPDGQVFDVQLKSPDGPGYEDWQSGVTTLSAEFSPRVSGAHKFRARLRRASDGQALKFSPPTRVRVSE